jgi:hypothetical protein
MTLGELRQRMTQDEVQTWVAYVEENGPLNSMLRFESMLARVAAPFFKQVKPKDLMIWPREPEPEATPEAIWTSIMNLSAATKRKH